MFAAVGGAKSPSIKIYLGVNGKSTISLKNVSISVVGFPNRSVSLLEGNWFQIFTLVFNRTKGMMGFSMTNTFQRDGSKPPTGSIPHMTGFKPYFVCWPDVPFEGSQNLPIFDKNP